jgi:SAM-dependent methyltransferase
MHSISSDQHTDTYDLLFDQMVSQRQENQASARVILQLLFERYVPKSVLDVGCGIGNWLSVAREMGVDVIRGVDGPWLDRSQLVVEPDLVSIADLESPLNLDHRFDLAICLETAEHLPSTAADTLVESLVRHAPAVLFSAAIPYQRGPNHVNEQWPNYWAEKFSRFRYCPLDFIRYPIWYESQVLWWYRQNVMLYVDYDWCASQPLLFREGQIQNLRTYPISVVLPDLFLTVAKKLHELEEAIMRGGHYQLEVDDHRLLHLMRMGEASSDGNLPHVTISAPQRKS